MNIRKPYLVFLGDARDQLAAKTAHGVVDWRKDWCIGQFRMPNCQADCGLQDMTLREAVDKGAQTLLVGVANAGGVLPAHWVAVLEQALELGMDLVSGLHQRMSDIDTLREAATRNKRQLIDIRHPTQRFDTGKGVKRTGMRLLTVGTDCSVGKKYTALSLEKAMNEAGFKASFRATGQTGLLIAETGVAIDAVASDFISGAVEWLSPATDKTNWHLIEGQGSLFHPSFAGVSLGLLHGAQPDAFVVCHEPTRKTLRGVSTPIPSIRDVIDLTLNCGRLTNPAMRCSGIAINTSALEEKEARKMLDQTSQHYGLPATDPIRFGVQALVDHLKALYPHTVTK